MPNGPPQGTRSPPPPTIPDLSPSGQKTCPSTGPLTAEILLVGESPANNEIQKQEPFVGQAGRILNLCLTPAGINRPDVRIANCIPAIAPGGTDFSRHHPADLDWGNGLLRQEIDALPNLKVIVPMGNNPLSWLMGLHQITKWRGSLFPPANELKGDRYNEYWPLLHRQPQIEVPDHLALISTFHPSAVSRQFPWHYWAINDFRRANEYANGSWKKPHFREWFVNRPDQIDRFVDHVLIKHEHLVSIDTEMNPAIVSLTSEEEVHVFTFHESYRPALERLMSSPLVLKLAHNMAHDWRQFLKVFEIPVHPPWFDTIAAAHILEPSGMDPSGDREKAAGEQQVGKKLSPHIATRYTPWPFHKWLESIDQHHYCGVDSVVAYDAYWNQLDQLMAMPKGLELINHDHKLFGVTMAMQNRGLRIDEPAREREIDTLGRETRVMKTRLEELSAPYIRAAYEKGSLKKPHLFKKTIRCKCCRGADKKKDRCWSCAGFDHAPSLAELKEYAYHTHHDAYEDPYFWHLNNKLFPTMKRHRTRDIFLPRKEHWEAAILEPCQTCDNGEGSWEEWQPINFDSPDQIKDLLYRVLRIPPRRAKGKETINIHQLIPLVEPGGVYDVANRATDHPRYIASVILSLYVERNQLVTQLETVQEMEPNEVGRIHPMYDLWFTPTQRVASRASLHDPGRNAQNISKRARRFIIPSPEYAFNYPDYAQIEARCVAVRCKDKKLIEIFQDPTKDSHMEVARLIEGSCGTKISRDGSKRVTYAAMYGIEAEHLATILGITILEAKIVLQAFFSTFTGLSRYRAEVVRELRSSRSNTSPTGWRRRWLQYIMVTKGRDKGTVRPKVIKEALATTPQNMAARILGLGLINMYENHGDWLHPVAHVHDAGLFEEPLDRMVEADQAILEGMTVNQWDMPFPAAPSHGSDWYIASLDKDEDKIKNGFPEWTREAVLANG